MMTFGSLFAGIGGFDLGLERAGMICKWQVENNPFCTKVLEKHWPDVPICEDIKKFRGRDNAPRQQIQKSSRSIQGGAINSGNSRPIQNNTASNVEDSQKKGVRFQEQYSLWAEESFLQGNKSIGQGSEYFRAGYRRREDNPQNCLRTMREIGNLQGWKADDPSASCGLCGTFESGMAMPKMPPPMAQAKHSEGEYCINEEIDVLTAGTPCQPASCAGKRRGREDDRWLWEETLRVIAEVKPKWCILENVRGLLTLEQGMAFEYIILELEAIGYETRTFIIPACALNAPHRRDRVWIVAYSGCELRQGAIIGKENAMEDRKENADQHKRSVDALAEVIANRNRQRCDGEPICLQSGEARQACDEIARGDSTIADTNRNRLQEPRAELQADRDRQLNETIADTKGTKCKFAREPRAGREGFANGCQSFTDAGKQRLQGHGQSGERAGKSPFGSNPWQEPWLEAATRLCRVDDGVSSRVHRLRSLGNAVVPQIVEVIGRAIMEVEYGNR